MLNSGYSFPDFTVMQEQKADVGGDGLYDGKGGGSRNVTPASRPITALAVCITAMRSYMFWGGAHQATLVFKFLYVTFCYRYIANVSINSCLLKMSTLIWLLFLLVLSSTEVSMLSS